MKIIKLVLIIFTVFITSCSHIFHSASSISITLQSMIDNASVGDTINVPAYNYPETLNITKSIKLLAQSGTVVECIHITANSVTISGFEITDTNPNTICSGIGIYMTGVGNIISNNYIHDMPWGGIETFANPSIPAMSSKDLISNNIIYHVGQLGMEIHGTNNIIQNNEISHIIQYFPTVVNPPSWVDADGIHFFGSGNLFRGNYIHDITLSDIGNKNPHIDAFQTWDDSGDPAGNTSIFEDNIVSLSGNVTSGFQLEAGVHDLTIRNNIVTAWVGLEAHANGNKPNNIYILNNLWNSGLQYTSSEYPAGVSFENLSSNFALVENNIFINQKGQTIWTASSSNVVYDYNLFWNSDGSTPYGSSHKTHDIWGINPQFIGSVDYHLQSTSKVIDAGITLSQVLLDFDGVDRPQGKAYDIGPYEYILFPMTATPTSISTLVPTSTSTNVPTNTYTPKPTSTPTYIPTYTFTVTPTFTPTNMPTSTPISKNIYINILYRGIGKNLNIRLTPSLFNYSTGYYLPNCKFVPLSVLDKVQCSHDSIFIENIVTNSEGIFGEINSGNYIALYINSIYYTDWKP